VLSHFCAGNNNNGGLWGGLTLDAKGNLYGTTWGGGTYGRGTVFELSPVSGGRWKKKVLHSFNNSDGVLRYSTLFLDSRGDLYGTTDLEVFEMTPASNGWNFGILENNYGSWAGVVLDQAGNLYGNIGPGEYSEGAVTELVRGSDGWTQSYLYSFCQEAYCPDGSTPVSGVIFDSAGNLYGSTEYGGTGQLGGLGGGTAYELKHKPDGTWQHVVLHNFPAFRGDGFYVYNGLVLDKSGNLYGAAAQGGSIDCGTVFKLTHVAKGWKESILHDFKQPTSGCGPSRVTFDAVGNLYGTTVGGGGGDCNGGCGVVFKLTPSSDGKWTYSALHRFKDYDGAVPDSGVILDQKGNLYGTTGLGGGGSSVGVVFEITPQ
jgi:uncharacterized repeat protein (TIGR03803 family)